MTFHHRLALVTIPCCLVALFGLATPAAVPYKPQPFKLSAKQRWELEIAVSRTVHPIDCGLGDMSWHTKAIERVIRGDRQSVLILEDYLYRRRPAHGKKYEWEAVSGAFKMLAKMPCDAYRYYPRAIECLQVDDSRLQTYVLHFLSTHAGGNANHLYCRMLEAHPDFVAPEAARCLVLHGGAQELRVLELKILTLVDARYDYLRAELIRCRDELRQRLDR